MRAYLYEINISLLFLKNPFNKHFAQRAKKVYLIARTSWVPNHGRHFAVGTKYCVVAPNILVLSAWYVFLVNLREKILELAVRYGKICAPHMYVKS